MAARPGTNPGSTPEDVGVGVGVGVSVGVAVGVGESVDEGVGDSDASGEEEPLGVDVGPVLTAAAEVHPPSTIAMAIPVQARTIPRDKVPPGIHR
jgi:hypothetical protein